MLELLYLNYGVTAVHEVLRSMLMKLPTLGLQRAPTENAG